MKSGSNGSNLLQSSPGIILPTSVSPTRTSTRVDINTTNINFTYQQISPTKIKRYEKTNNHLKHYEKPNRKVAESFLKEKIQSMKPITFNQHEQNQFAIESISKNNFEKSQQLNESTDRNSSLFHNPCIGLINPMYINVKSNPKRLTYSCQLSRENQESRQKFNKKKINQNYNFIQNSKNNSTKINHLSPKKQLKNTQNLYFKIVSEMNDYFSTMKLASFKNNKTQMLSKRNTRAQSQKRIIEEQKVSPHILKKQNIKIYEQEDNLNIIGLRPRTTDYQRIERKNVSVSQFNRGQSAKRSQKDSLFASKFSESQQFIPNLNEKIKCQIQNFDKSQELTFSNNISSLMISHEISRSTKNNFRHQKIRSLKQSAHQMRQFSPQKTAKINVFKGYCFGEINLAKLPQQEIYRLKVLYYKDLLWKNNWNLQVKYFPACEGTKYYVGRGNNSKLIKNLMTKRWWWSLQQKEQNSQFIWTQLKIYSIYEKQPNLFTEFQNLKPELQQTQIKIQTPTKNKIQENSKKLSLFDNSALVLSQSKKNRWQSYILSSQNLLREKKMTEQILQQRRKVLFNFKQPLIQNPSKITNHLQFSRVIGNKKALYKVMMTYFQKIKLYSMEEIYVPLTYHITAGLQDEEYLKFLSQYYRRNKSQGKTCWIVKPGQLTNRGNGIRYCKDLNEIKPIVKKKETHPNGTLKTFLIQSYIDRPLLYKGRKFDIRHYIMISSINGKLRGYFYKGGYIRTTSYKYRLEDNSAAVHLTNDAVQKYCKDYGRYEKGNKLSYEQFDQYMKQKCQQNVSLKSSSQFEANQKKISFFNTILPQIKQISTDVIHAAYYFIDPSRRSCNFQIFGLDIMIDESLKCYLIEVNTNPCLQLSSPVLRNVIPQMLDNALSLTLDCCYPPPQKEPLAQYYKKYKYPQSTQNKFEIVFDEDIHGRQIRRTYQNEGIQQNEVSGIGDDDQNFQSCDEDNQDY